MSNIALVDGASVDAELDLVIGEIEQDLSTSHDAEASTCARVYCSF
ncbi:MAG: hypothetical protein H7233_16415 [Pseudorhodobacter sp.]|nr:hypothetical protein [Frankiaceae bacterium]